MDVRVGNRIVKLGTALNRGGVGSVHRDGKLLLKVMDPDKLPPPGKVEYMLDNPPSPRHERGQPTFAWPLEPVRSMTSKTIGFSMEEARNAEVVHRIVYPKLCHPALQANRPWLVCVAHSLAMRIYALNWDNYYFADFNLMNFLVHRYGFCTAIDCDSVAFETATSSFACEFVRPEMQPPEFLDATRAKYLKRDKWSEAWSLAVCVHQLLRRGQHPFDAFFNGQGTVPTLPDMIRTGQWIDSPASKDFVCPRGVQPFSEFPKRLKDLFEQTFKAGHGEPTARARVLDFVECLEAMKATWR